MHQQMRQALRSIQFLDFLLDHAPKANAHVVAGTPHNITSIHLVFDHSRYLQGLIKVQAAVIRAFGVDAQSR